MGGDWQENREEKRAKYQMRVGRLGNRLKTPFEIQIVEHVYDGSPRWRERDVDDSYRAHTGDTSSPAAREPEVRWAMGKPGSEQNAA
ncbi:MAG: hypothetical protein P8166_03005 [Candidatus Thiodiazotropha sp.]|jgi:hypothetical protein